MIDTIIINGLIESLSKEGCVALGIAVGLFGREAQARGYVRRILGGVKSKVKR